MDRRSFFKSMIGGIAATAAVRTWPFRVFSFSHIIQIAPRPVSIRFIRAFDPMQMRMINRFDAIYGFSLERLQVPNAVDAAEALHSFNENGLCAREVDDFKERCIKRWVPNAVGWQPLAIPDRIVKVPDGEVVHRAWEIAQL